MAFKHDAAGWLSISTALRRLPFVTNVSTPAR